MKAQILKQISPVESRPLKLIDLPIPRPGPREILVKVSLLKQGKMQGGAVLRMS